MAKYVLGPNAARKFRQLMNGSGRVSERSALGSQLAIDVDFALPYAVQWAQSANGGDGAWIIWLPGEILSIAGKVFDPSEGLDAVGGDYPSGWYLLDDGVLDFRKGGTLYLNVNPDAADGETCVFASEAGKGSDEGDTFSFAICEASVDSVSGARSVCQIVASAIIVGGSGSPDGISLDDLGGEGGESLQIAHFNDDERNSGKGIAGRLKVDVKTGAVSAADESDGIMMICRSGDGQIVYMPIGGDGEDPETDEDCCKDPSGGGGVDAGSSGSSGSGGVAGGVAGGHGGGVSAGGNGGQSGDACPEC